MDLIAHVQLLFWAEAALIMSELPCHWGPTGERGGKTVCVVVPSQHGWDLFPGMALERAGHSSWCCARVIPLGCGGVGGSDSHGLWWDLHGAALQPPGKERDVLLPPPTEIQ